MKTIKEEIILFLVNKKDDLAIEIENIIYADLDKEVTIKDLTKINDIKKKMNECYEIIDILEK